MNENLNANATNPGGEEVIVEEVKESKIKVAINKTVGVAKKHGKKILAGLGVGLLTALAYEVGKHSMMEDESNYVPDEDFIGLAEAEDVVVEDDAE